VNDSRQENQNILRVMGFIGFVSLLNGASVVVYADDLWIKTGSIWVDGTIYIMGAFTLQGISYTLYKLLLQENMDTRAKWSVTQKQHNRRLQEMQSQFASVQMERELKIRQKQMEHQMNILENNPEGYMAMMGGTNLGILDDKFRQPQTFENGTEDFNPPPKHKIDENKPVNLGVDYGKAEDVPLTKDGKPDKRYKTGDDEER
jgi:hypothetical protein